MNKNDIEAIYPLSPAQQGMLFHTLYTPEAGVYFEQLDCTIEGDLHVPAFWQAWQQVIARHPILRTLFIWERRDKPLQVVRPRVNLPAETLDWRGLSPEQQSATLTAWLKTDRDRGLALDKAPVMRLALIRLAEQRYQFVWSYHHLLLDGWSNYRVLQEVFTAYEALRQGRLPHFTPSRPFRDYIIWLQQQDLTRAEAFWRQALRGVSHPTPLNLDDGSRRQANAGQGYAESYTRLSADLTAALQTLARQHQLTLNTLVQGIYALLLGRLSGENDVIFGTTVSGRPPTLPGVETMIGMFINTLPVRVNLPSQASLLAWLRAIQEQQAEMRQFEYSPLVEIQRWSEIPRGQSLFESILVFENYPADTTWNWAESLTIRNVRFFGKTNYPLTILIEPGNQLAIKVKYDDQRFDAAAIAQLTHYFNTLCTAMTTGIERRLADITLLDADDRRRLLVEWNDTGANYPLDQCIHHRFEHQVERYPDRVAVMYEGQWLTYAELNRRANQLAHYLRELGVGPEVPVAICLERSLAMIVALLGVLKAGGAYVPLEPTLPQDRLAFLLADTSAPILLTQESLRVKLPSRLTHLRVVFLDTERQHIARYPDSNVTSGVQPENLAYVLFTSGSTGQPKGVAVEHRQLLNYTQAILAQLDLPAGASFATVSSFAADLGNTAIFPALCSGGTLHVISQERASSPDDLADYCQRHPVDCLKIVPSHLSALLTAVQPERLLPRKRLILGGEACHWDLIKQVQALAADCVILNHYGPTETTVGVLTYRVTQPDDHDHLPTVPLGRPLHNTQIYILDTDQRPAPVGTPGEIYIGGAGVARGYFRQPALTAERFIPNPFWAEKGKGKEGHEEKGNDSSSCIPHPSSLTLYRTGDRARYLPDGNIEFLGRVDQQVKLRGYRVEPGEIEAILAQQPAVKDAVVVAWQNGFQDRRLVGYVVPKRGQIPTSHDLHDFLSERLPDYMIPSAFVLLKTLPLTANGKVDRRALPAPTPPGTIPETNGTLSDTFVAPRDLLELQLVRLWEDLLDVRPVGVTANFFDLGGHSLLAIRLMAQIQQRFGQKLPLPTILQGGTVEHLARVLRQQAVTLPRLPLVEIQPSGSGVSPTDGSRPPLFLVHPVGGNVLCYASLARQLGADQPVYGLQAVGLDGEQPPYTHIEAMATHYIKALRAVQPRGPYCLGGWSMGGVVAFEMAQQLRQQGERTAFLALLDSRAITSNHKKINCDSNAALLAEFIRDLGGTFARDLQPLCEHLQQLPVEKQIEYALEQAKRLALVPPDAGPAYIAHLLAVFRANLQAVATYRPQVYPGRITLFRIDHNTTDTQDPTLGWSAFSQQPVEVYLVPGNHYTLLSPPNVQVLAEVIRACLDKVQATHPIKDVE